MRPAAPTRPSSEGGPSFSASHKAYRALWLVSWALLAGWTPPPFHPWRRLILRAFGAKIAPTARVSASAKIWYPPNLELGHNAVIGPGAICYAMSRISIGDYAVVSQGAHLCCGTHALSDPGFALLSRPIVLGARSWVAAEAFVGPGVTVGEGAVLGARCVVFKDVAAWTVMAGIPARAIKMRSFNDRA